MNKSTYYIALDIERTEAQGNMSVRRGESGRRLVATLMSGGKPFDPDKGAYAVFAARRADGATLFNGCTLSAGRAVYELTAQTTGTVGRVECEIRIYGEDGELIVSPRFCINVFDTAVSDDEIASAPEYTALTELVAQAQDAVAACRMAGIDEATASVDDTVGAPSVNVALTQGENGGILRFAFSGLRGEKGERGADGARGEKGDKGESGFTYEDFTPEQLEALRGEKGAQGERGEKGDKGDTGERGEKGESFTYDDFTPEQLAALKGEKGDNGKDGTDGAKGEKGDKGDTGEKGEAFTYADFTPTQLAALKGEKGEKGDKGDSGADGADGAAGYTPVCGKDYFTDEDKQQIVADVLAAMPDGDEVQY